MICKSRFSSVVLNLHGTDSEAYMKIFIFDIGASNCEHIITTYIYLSPTSACFWIPQLSMNTRCLARQNIQFSYSMLLDFFCILEVLMNAGCLTIKNLLVWSHCLCYSVHAAQGGGYRCFAEFSVYEIRKMIQIIVMLSVRLYALKGRPPLKRFP